MPNHVANRIMIEADGPLLDEILEAVKFDNVGAGSIDFEKVEPMPPELDIEESSRADEALEIYREMTKLGLSVGITEKDGGINIEVSGEYQENINSFSKKYLSCIAKDPKLIDLGKRRAENIANHGSPSWYDWHVVHWGTKWNSYGYEGLPPYEQGSGVINFDTAWSAARPIARRLSEMYPDATFHIAWSDEDIGYNLGEETYREGELVDSYIPEGGSMAAYRFAMEIREIDEWMANKDGTDIVFIEDNIFSIINFDGRQVLYSEKELTESEVPENLNLAYLYGNAGEEYITISPKPDPPDGLMPLGSIMSKEPFFRGSEAIHHASPGEFPDIAAENASIGDYLRLMEKDSHAQEAGNEDGMKLT